MKKMEIVKKLSTDDIITVRTIFFFTTNTPNQNETVTIEKKDLEGCNSSNSDATIVVITFSVLVLLGAFAAFCFYKRKKDIEDSKEEIEVNPTYGEGAFYDYDYKTSEVNTSNDYY